MVRLIGREPFWQQRGQKAVTTQMKRRKPDWLEGQQLPLGMILVQTRQRPATDAGHGLGLRCKAQIAALR